MTLQDSNQKRSESLVQLAKELANERPEFFKIKGAGKVDRDTGAFMKELRARAKSTFGTDYSEQRICGDTNLAVDFYFPEEGAIVEVALGLRNPLSEYERDIFKALMAKEGGSAVSRLLFITKPGGLDRINQPGARAITKWLEVNHGITIGAIELKPKHTT